MIFATSERFTCSYERINVGFWINTFVVDSDEKMSVIVRVSSLNVSTLPCTCRASATNEAGSAQTARIGWKRYKWTRRYCVVQRRSENVTKPLRYIILKRYEHFPHFVIMAPAPKTYTEMRAVAMATRVNVRHSSVSYFLSLRFRRPSSNLFLNRTTDNVRQKASGANVRKWRKRGIIDRNGTEPFALVLCGEY